ncbi:MAG: hypothetical protein ABSD47_10205 [Candidatus Methylomirabilota bacterium]|jgi:hypothetical protein
MAIPGDLDQVAADQLGEVPLHEVRHGLAAGRVQEAPHPGVHPEAPPPVLGLPRHAREPFLDLRPLVLQVRLRGRLHLEAHAFLLQGREGRVELGEAAFEAEPLLRGEQRVLRLRDGLLRRERRHIQRAAFHRRTEVAASSPAASRASAARVSSSYLHTERRKPGVTLELLHLEYLEERLTGYRYTCFCDLYRRWLTRNRLPMRQ